MDDWMKEITYDMLPPKQQELADVIGLEATLKLCDYVAGQGMYIPGNDRAFMQLRNRRIRRDYFEKGMGIAALGRKYGLTANRIRGIVQEGPDARG